MVSIVVSEVIPVKVIRSSFELILFIVVSRIEVYGSGLWVKESTDKMRLSREVLFELFEGPVGLSLHPSTPLRMARERIKLMKYCKNLNIELSPCELYDYSYKRI